MKKLLSLLSLILLVTAVSTANASSITLDSSHLTETVSGQASLAVPGPAVHDFAASATFTLDPGSDTLTLTLTNASTQAVTDPAQLVSAIFWNSTTPLTPGSAALTSGSAWVNPSNVTLNIGGNYSYKDALRQTGTDPAPTNQGVSAVGIGLFGDGNFGGLPVPVDGDAYDLLPQLGIAAGHTSPFANKYPLAKNSMTFTFSTSADSITIEDVIFHYSSAYSGVNLPGDQVPLPPTAFLLGSGLVGMGLLGFRSKRKA
jgi:hypothetical protein